VERAASTTPASCADNAEADALLDASARGPVALLDVATGPASSPAPAARGATVVGLDFSPR